VKVALSDADLSFGDNVQIENASGELVIAPDGIASRLSATATLDAEGLFDGSFSVGIEVNTRPTAVGETFLVGGVQKTLSLPAGPFLRVEVLVPENDPIEIGSAGRSRGPSSSSVRARRRSSPSPASRPGWGPARPRRRRTARASSSSRPTASRATSRARSPSTPAR